MTPITRSAATRSKPTVSAPISQTWPSTTSPTASTSWRRRVPGLAREVADGWSTPDYPRFVLGSVGPGTKLPTLGHTTYATLRDAYQQEVAGLIDGGADADLGRDGARPAAGEGRDYRRTPSVDRGRLDAPADRAGHRRDDRHDAARIRNRRGADRARAARHRPDRAQLRDRAGRDGRAPALPRPARPAWPFVHAERRPARARPRRRELPADTRRARRGPRRVHRRARARARRRLLRHDADAPAAGGRARAWPRAGAPASAPRTRCRRRCTKRVAFRQDTSYLAVGERTNANGSRVFRDAMLEGRFEDCVEVARDATRDGSHLHRRMRRLRRPRRRRRHARDRRPVRDGVDVADHARLHRAAGHRGRP